MAFVESRDGALALPVQPQPVIIVDGIRIDQFIMMIGVDSIGATMRERTVRLCAIRSKCS